jgi:hypothetical protein
VGRSDEELDPGDERERRRDSEEPAKRGDHLATRICGIDPSIT